MNQNFIRISNMLSKYRSNWPEKSSMKNKANNVWFFIYFKKIFYLIVLGLYAHDLYKNAKYRIVISFLSQTLCETAVSSSQWSCSSFQLFFPVHRALVFLFRLSILFICSYLSFHSFFPVHNGPALLFSLSILFKMVLPFSSALLSCS